MKEKNIVIGVDLGGTKISAAVFELNGNIVHKEIRQLAHRKGKEVLALLGELILQLKDKANSSSLNLRAVGICVPGIYDPVNKTAWAPNIPGWDNYPIWHELNLFLRDPSISIVIENDRSCYILGEVWKGCAKKCSDAIFLAVGICGERWGS